MSTLTSPLVRTLPRRPDSILEPKATKPTTNGKHAANAAPARPAAKAAPKPSAKAAPPDQPNSKPNATRAAKPPAQPKRIANSKPSSKPTLTAANADRFALYQASVQEPDVDLDFLDRQYKRAFARFPARLREDFCGTALTASRFVQRRPTNSALGVDLDPKPIAWGRANILPKLKPDQQARIQIIQANVLSDQARDAGPFDAILAFNFSYWILQQRATLIDYFTRCRKALARDGMLVLDFMAGSDVLTESTERSRKRGFTYVWDQRRYDPLSGQMTCHIGFEFPDGTALPRAFTYTWRLYTMPEVKDILADAGFTSIEFFLEGEDAKGDGTGVYAKRAQGPADRCLLAYIIARA